MPENVAPGFMVEPQKEVPIAYDVDVAVVGAGIAGLFAAIAAGRRGARTLLIDRFGMLGGNIGPAMIVAGDVYNEADATMPGGLAGTPKQLIERMEQLRGTPGQNFADQTNIISYLGVKMAEEAGVQLLLSVWAADPIVENGAVRGLFVEGKSGRVAVRARVVVDASSDADMARRANVPVVIDTPADPGYGPLVRPQYNRPEYVPWNDTGLFYMMAGVDLTAYREFRGRARGLDDAEQAWVQKMAETYPSVGRLPHALVPPLKREWDSGGYRVAGDIEPRVHYSMSARISNYGNGLAGTDVDARGAIRREDTGQNSRLEAALRVHAFETVQFLKGNAPGFGQAYLLFVAPYFGARGGPYIDAEHTLTIEEAFSGKKFDDTLFLNIHEGQKQHGGDPSGHDVPYRMTLPKHIDGLLVTGRCAGYVRRGHDPTGMRARPSVMVFGHATGTAAALAARDGATPKTLDVKTLQRALLEDGLHLGDEARLAELGLDQRA